jgi:hypothetical protein
VVSNARPESLGFWHGQRPPRQRKRVLRAFQQGNPHQNRKKSANQPGMWTRNRVVGWKSTGFCLESERNFLPMNILNKLLPALAAFATLAIAVRASVEVGQPAPNFTLTDINGQARSLSDYKGKIVVLEWNNPDCPFVKKHYESGNIPSLQKTASVDGIVWLTINSGATGGEGGDYTSAEIKSWLQKNAAAPTAYFHDPDGKVGHLYGAKTTPDMYVINADGTLVYKGAIDSIRSAKIADIARATNYVKAALDALKSGQPIAKPVSEPYGCSVKY